MYVYNGEKFETKKELIAAVLEGQFGPNIKEYTEESVAQYIARELGVIVSISYVGDVKRDLYGKEYVTTAKSDAAVIEKPKSGIAIGFVLGFMVVGIAVVSAIVLSVVFNGGQ